MTNQFTYHGILEDLKDKLQWEDKSSSEMEERFRLMGILYHVTATIDHFEKAIQKAEESIIIRDLADVNLDNWTNINNWDIPGWLTNEEMREAHLLHYWNIHNNRAYINPKLSNDITGLLPAPPKMVEYNNDAARNGINDFFQFFQGVYFNSHQLRCAIYQGILALAETLENLQTAIHKERTNEEYTAWYNELSMEFSTKLIMGIDKQYKTVKTQRLIPINRDWLLDRFGASAQAFWDSSFMHAMKAAISNKECKDQPIHFDIPELSKEHQKKFFYILEEFGTFNENGYTIDKLAQIGQCLYRLYATEYEQVLTDFFTFILTANLISVDLANYSITTKPKSHAISSNKSKLNKRTKKNDISVPYTIRYINSNDQSRIQRLTLLMQCLQNLKWIEEPKNADDFIDLFDGRPRECNIRWTDTLNQASVYYFLQQLLAQPYIEKVAGCSARSLMMNQFHFANPRADEKRITTDNKIIISRLLSIINPQKRLPIKTEDFANDLSDMNSTSWNYLEDGLHATKDINSRY